MGAATTATISGLAAGVTYDIHVVAYDPAGRISGPSNVVRHRVPGSEEPPLTAGGGTNDGGGRDIDRRPGASAYPPRAYLAEGAESALFTTVLGVANPGRTPVDAQVVVQPDRGTPGVIPLRVPPMAHVETTASPVLGAAGGAFGVTARGNGPLALARTILWAGGRGGHAEMGTPRPSRRWYFAEGATGGPFELFLLVMNPGTSTARVAVTYLRPEGAPLVGRHLVAPGTRLTIWVDQEAPQLTATDVAMVVESEAGPAIVAERAMYLAGPSGFTGGHAALGVTAPRTRWLMAEGATGAFFNLFLLLANPGTAPADVELRFRLPDGQLVRHRVRVAPRRRHTVNVGALDPRLADTAVWTEVRVRNGVPVVAERVMWWPGSGWADGHVAPATPRPAARWLAGGGRSGGSRGFDTYVLVANASGAPVAARVTVLGPAGPVGTVVLEVPARGRTNVDMSALFPHVTGAYSVLVEAVDGTRALVVEQATYWDARGQHWGAGAASAALPLE